jgi:hydroxyacyl-ACP dehydratase HTD2-like protein with hotdog domain
MRELKFEDMEVGYEIPPLARTPSNLQLFMFSAVTWNCHRIHFDADFAREHDKLPDVLAQRPLLGSFLCQMLTDWLGDSGRIARLQWSNRGPAVPGDRLTCKGRVVGKSRTPDRATVQCDVWIEKDGGEIIVPGKAEVVLTCRQT